MPRIPRGETAGGIYHIINRGNMRMQVFDDREEYDYFLELLEIAAKRDNVEVHAYCLMPNHFHLLLIPKEPNSLSKLILQWVMTSYVRYYHKKNKISGHIWQGRYKSFASSHRLRLCFCTVSGRWERVEMCKCSLSSLLKVTLQLMVEKIITQCN